MAFTEASGPRPPLKDIDFLKAQNIRLTKILLTASRMRAAQIAGDADPSEKNLYNKLLFENQFDDILSQLTADAGDNTDMLLGVILRELSEKAE
ncbi:MAG: hypothetical protein LBQ51_07795 [Desulfovibrio sp.]|jgi:hypothetical protein|nr:hypothetical protein [Desulfovibrio sp.]